MKKGDEKSFSHLSPSFGARHVFFNAGGRIRGIRVESFEIAACISINQKAFQETVATSCNPGAFVTPKNEKMEANWEQMKWRYHLYYIFHGNFQWSRLHFYRDINRMRIFISIWRKCSVIIFIAPLLGYLLGG